MSAPSLDTVVLAPGGYLLDPDVGSDYERPWRLAEGLAKRGLRVVVVAREAKRIQDLGSSVELAYPPGRPPSSPVGRIIDRANLYLHARRIAYREVASGRASVVHHLGPCGEQSPSLIGKLPVPFVYGPLPASRPDDPQDDEWLSWLLATGATHAQARLSQIVAGPASVAARWQWRRTIDRADAITVEAQANMPPRTREVVVIRPGIDTILFRPRSAGLPVPGRIVAVGRLLTRKAYDVLIRALSHVLLSERTAHLVLAGSGPREQSLRQLADQLGIAASITFSGNISRAELVPLLQSAEVFCHPANWDNVPFAPLEAMACGLPTIVSSAGALPELVGEAGIIHSVGDAQDLARRLLEVLTSARLRQALATAARNRILEHFTWQGMSDSYFDLYQELVRSKRNPSQIAKT